MYLFTYLHIVYHDTIKVLGPDPGLQVHHQGKEKAKETHSYNVARTRFDKPIMRCCAGYQKGTRHSLGVSRKVSSLKPDGF